MAGGLHRIGVFGGVEVIEVKKDARTGKVRAIFIGWGLRLRDSSCSGLGRVSGKIAIGLMVVV
jgi:hypothetical protein